MASWRQRPYHLYQNNSPPSSKRATLQLGYLSSFLALRSSWLESPSKVSTDLFHILFRNNTGRQDLGCVQITISVSAASLAGDCPLLFRHTAPSADPVLKQSKLGVRSRVHLTTLPYGALDPWFSVTAITKFNQTYLNSRHTQHYITADISSIPIVSKVIVQPFHRLVFFASILGLFIIYKLQLVLNLRIAH